MADIPAPPPGFQLQSSNGIPAPPAGFQMDVVPDDAVITAAMQHQASLPPNERAASMAALPLSVQQGIAARIRADAQAASTPEARAARFQQLQAQNMASEPWYQKFGEGFGHSFVNAGRGIGEAIGIESPQDVAEARRLDQGLMDTGWGKAGDWTGQGAQLVGTAALGGIGGAALKALPAVADAVPVATSALGKLGTASAIGAGYGYLSPYASEGEHVANTAIGAAAPVAFMGAAKGTQALGRGGKAIIDRFLNPDAVADSIVARRLAGDPGAAQAIASYTPAVPGERPTLAQAVQSPQAVQLERMARSNPVSGPEIVAQDNANNAARMALLKRHLGMDHVASTPSGAPIDAMQAADMTRKTNLRNFIDSNMGPERLVHTGDIADALAPLTSSSNPTVKSAARQILSDMEDKANAAGTGEFLHPTAMDDIRQNIGNVMRQASNNAGSGKQGAAQAMALLGPVQQKIVDAIDAVSPGYRQAVQDYALQSVPVNTAQQFRKFLDEDATRSLNASGDREATASKVAAFLNRANKSEFGISPQARADTKAVQKSLLDRSVVDQKIGAAGSNTDADAQNRFAAAAARHAGAVAGGTLGSWLGPLGTLGGLAAGHGADYLNGIANQRIAAAIGDRVMNPALANQAIVNRLGLLGRRQATNNLLLGASPYVGLGTDALLRANAPRIGQQ